MNTDNWYRGSEWNNQIKELFEKRLKKARGGYNKSQYLRIKGSYLLSSANLEIQKEGINLLTRVVNEYPNEVFNTILAYEQLGDYFSQRNEYNLAEFNYRKSISYYEEYGRSGSSGIGDIKLAEMIVMSEQKNKYSEMFKILTEDFKVSGGNLFLNDNKFRYYSVLAKLSFRLHKKQIAKEYAKIAINLLSIGEPQIKRYPNLGIINVHEGELKLLNEILNND